MKARIFGVCVGIVLMIIIGVVVGGVLYYNSSSDDETDGSNQDSKTVKGYIGISWIEDETSSWSGSIKMEDTTLQISDDNAENVYKVSERTNINAIQYRYKIYSDEVKVKIDNVVGEDMSLERYNEDEKSIGNTIGVSSNFEKTYTF